MSKEKAPCHVPESWFYNEGEVTGEDTNPIIEEIMVILTSQKITIETAKQILNDTLEAIDREAILKDRIVDGELIRGDQ